MMTLYLFGQNRRKWSPRNDTSMAVLNTKAKLRWSYVVREKTTPLSCYLTSQGISHVTSCLATIVLLGNLPCLLYLMAFCPSLRPRAILGFCPGLTHTIRKEISDFRSSQVTGKSSCINHVNVCKTEICYSLFYWITLTWWRLVNIRNDAWCMCMLIFLPLEIVIIIPWFIVQMPCQWDILK